MEFNLKARIHSGLGLAAFLIVALVIGWLGTVALTRGGRQEAGGAEVAVDIRARHGFDQAQQDGIERPDRGLDVRP